MNILEKRTIKNLIHDVRKDSRILALFLFGSAARGDNYKGSDIDVCIVLKDNFYSVRALSLFKIDYLQLYGELDIHIFQQLPIYIKKRVIKEGKLLFCSDEDSLYRIVFSVLREFSVFEYFYKDYLREVSDAG